MSEPKWLPAARDLTAPPDQPRGHEGHYFGAFKSSDQLRGLKMPEGALDSRPVPVGLAAWEPSARMTLPDSFFGVDRHAPCDLGAPGCTRLRPCHGHTPVFARRQAFASLSDAFALLTPLVVLAWQARMLCEEAGYDDHDGTTALDPKDFAAFEATVHDVTNALMRGELP